jgi:hypothetical protein
LPTASKLRLVDEQPAAAQNKQALAAKSRQDGRYFIEGSSEVVLKEYWDGATLHGTEPVHTAADG